MIGCVELGLAPIDGFAGQAASTAVAF